MPSPRLPRETHKLFGVAGSTSKFAKFGSEQAGVPFKTKDIATIQGLPAWDNGLQDALFSGNKAILLEDINGWFYEHSYQVATIMQDGVAAWHTGTTYNKGSLVQRISAGGDATGEVYASLIDANAGNALPVQASNANWLWLNPPEYIVGGAATVNSLPKVAGPATVGPAGSQAMIDSAVSEDGFHVKVGLPIQFPDNSVQGTAAAPITTQAVVTGARALNTTFHNTGLKPLLVTVSIEYLTGAFADFLTDTNPAPATQVARVIDSGGGDDMVISTTFVVLPGNYYRINGNGTLRFWTEWS